MVKMMAKYCTQELFSKFLISKVKSYAKCKAIDRNFKNYNFSLKNDTAHLLGMLIFLSGYTDYDLEYKRQGIYWWIHSNKTEKILWSDFKNWLPVCRTTNLVSQIYKPCHHDITTAKPSFRTATATTLRTKPEFRPAKTANSGDP